MWVWDKVKIELTKQTIHKEQLCKNKSNEVKMHYKKFSRLPSCNKKKKVEICLNKNRPLGHKSALN